ncbi:MAG: hypothetical protein ACXACY_14095 [Candidatus Hodarchaeales archaeon]|jgi:hypothetical protein
MRLSYVIRRRRAIHPLFKAIFLLGFLITSAIALFLITELFLIPYFTEKPDPIQNGSVIFEENTTTLTKNSTRIVLKITEGETATVTNINIFESSNESNTAEFTFSSFTFTNETKSIKNYTFVSDLESGNYTIRITYDIDSLEDETVSMELAVVILLVAEGWREFWVADVSSYPYEFYTINATLKIIANHSLIYSNSTSVSDGELLSMKNDFENIVYPTLTDYFGLPPDIDNNEKIILLVFDIDEIPSGFVAGFFYQLNQFLNSELNPSQRYSNEAEILHIDINAADDIGTIAHEFQHLIHFGHDDDEDTWLDEGASVFSEYLIGDNPLSGTYGTTFKSNPDVSLTYWDGSSSSLVFANYGASYTFMLYLAEHYGGDPLVQDLVERSADGIQSVEDALLNQGYDVEFTEVFRNWTIANFLDDPSFAGGSYGYNLDDILKPTVENTYDSSSPIAHTDNNVPYWGTDYLRFNQAFDSSFSFEFNDASDDGFMVTVVLMNTTTSPLNTRVIPVEIQPNGTGSFSIPSVNADEIYVAISAYTTGSTPDHNNTDSAPSQDYWFTVN